MKKIYLPVALLMLSFTSVAQARYLDPSFGKDGYVITNFKDNASLNSLAIQADGKVIAAGTSNGNFAIARYNIDGSADNNFGTNGKVITDLGNDENARSVAIQTDGKIVVAGYTETGIYPNIQSKIVVVRYNTDGSLDNSFGNDGKVITTVEQQTFCYALALQTDGKILVTGSTTTDGNETEILLVRYNTNGTPDNSFGTAGIVSTSYDFENEAYTIALQPDGKILTGGFTYDGSSNSTNSIIARYLQNGTLDNSFGENGFAIDYAGVTSALAIQADGKILYAGHGYNDNYDFYGTLSRLNTNGTKDTSFNRYGVVAGGYYSGFTSNVYDVVVQADGKAVVSVSRTSGYPEYKKELGVIRFNADGKADLTFGNNGLISVLSDAVSYGNPTTNPLAITADSKILSGATFKNNFAIARILTLNAVAFSNNQLKNTLIIHLYPNPVAASFMVNGLDKTLPAVITISDVAGNIMKVQKLVAGTTSVNVATLQQGRYVAVFTQNNKTGSVKFIKK